MNQNQKDTIKGPKGGDTTDKEEHVLLDVSLKNIAIDGEKIVIDSPKLAEILKAEKEVRSVTQNAVVLKPIVPVVPLEEVSTVRGKVTISSRELADIVKAEKDAQKKKISVVMAPTLPLPPP
ncbi:MAG: hypothetical protein PVF58_10440 [Candidatus Methanofastidiosia archaeon]|jgi:hypothetical protein